MIYKYSGCNSLANINLSSHLTSIGDSAFYACKNLIEIVLPASLIGIRDNTFENCLNLLNVIIPEGIVAISSHSFSGCWRLKSLRIPATLQYIATDSFAGNCCLTLEVPQRTALHYHELNIEGVIDIIEYDAQTPNNVEKLKAKCEDFVKIQNAKRERYEYELRKELGIMTKEERDIENTFYFDIKDDLY